jgi:hypothetical protein
MVTCGSRGSVVGIVTRLADGRFGIRIPTREDGFLFSKTFIPAIFSGYQPGREVHHLDIMPRLRMNGAIFPLPLMPSWRGQGQFYLIFIFTHITVVFVKLKGAMNRSGVGCEK